MLDCVLQAVRGTQRQFLIEAFYGHAHRLKRRVGALNYQSHVVPALLAIGNKEQRLGVIFLDFLDQISRDADDGDPLGWLVLVVEETKTLSNGILAGPQAGCGIAREDCGLVMSSSV